MPLAAIYCNHECKPCYKSVTCVRPAIKSGTIGIQNFTIAHQTCVVITCEHIKFRISRSFNHFYLIVVHLIEAVWSDRNISSLMSIVGIRFTIIIGKHSRCSILVDIRTNKIETAISKACCCFNGPV